MIALVTALIGYLVVGAAVFRVTLPHRWRRAYAHYPKIEPDYYTTLPWDAPELRKELEQKWSVERREEQDRHRYRAVIGSSCVAWLGWPVWVPLALARHVIDRADPDPLAPWEVAAMQDRIAELEDELEETG